MATFTTYVATGPITGVVNLDADIAFAGLVRECFRWGAGVLRALRVLRFTWSPPCLRMGLACAVHERPVDPVRGFFVVFVLLFLLLLCLLLLLLLLALHFIRSHRPHSPRRFSPFSDFR